MSEREGRRNVATKLGRSGRIADPIHGYANFTGIERHIIDHPIAQRLQYVAQNGLAHLVYPGARTSRFIHSLGTMNLASRFFTSSFEHCQKVSTRKKLCNGITSL